MFEAIMLFCFGASWPFAVLKTYQSKRVEGKSASSLILILIGYVAGIVHKLLHNVNWVILLYAANAILVLTDLLLLMYYRRLANASATPASSISARPSSRPST